MYLIYVEFGTFYRVKGVFGSEKGGIWQAF